MWLSLRIAGHEASACKPRLRHNVDTAAGKVAQTAAASQRLGFMGTFRVEMAAAHGARCGECQAGGRSMEPIDTGTRSHMFRT
jgi:hypothetical protein